jgi:hypothetical protein
MRNAIKSIRTALALVSVCFLGVSASAAPPKHVERFEAATWAELQANLPRPSAIVFTATYCATCPAVLGKIASALDAHDVEGEVIAVVIDEAQDEELLESKHYERASRLFLFSGNEASLRYEVDPRWRGVTPYIALLPAKGKPLFSAGSPSEEQIATWLAK